MTFREFCERHHLTAAERREAAWYLAALRMRATLEALHEDLFPNPRARRAETTEA